MADGPTASARMVLIVPVGIKWYNAHKMRNARARADNRMVRQHSSVEFVRRSVRRTEPHEIGAAQTVNWLIYATTKQKKHACTHARSYAHTHTHGLTFLWQRYKREPRQSDAETESIAGRRRCGLRACVRVCLCLVSSVVLCHSQFDGV